MDPENKDQVTEPGATPPEGQPQGKDQNPTNPEDKKPEPKTVTMTEGEFQSQMDKRVSEAIKTREENIRKQMTADIDKMVTERIEEERKIAKLKGEELAAYKEKKLVEEIEAERAKRAELEQRIERQGWVSQVLTDNKMDTRLAEVLTGSTLEEIQKQAEVINAVTADAITAYYKKNSHKTVPGLENHQPAQPIDTRGKSVEEILAECQVIED